MEASDAVSSSTAPLELKIPISTKLIVRGTKLDAAVELLETLTCRKATVPPKTGAPVSPIDTQLAGEGMQLIRDVVQLVREPTSLTVTGTPAFIRAAVKALESL